MSSRPPQKIEYPAIAPVPEGTHRPFWSVMIPTYNCANYLVQTLESVLAQDPGPEHMQIEVVDDCSTKDDPEAVVRKIGKGRVSFYRQPQNGGATHNFNTCIRRSKGKYGHILHGDDYVGKEFYNRFHQLINAHSDVALFTCRVFLVSEQGEIDTISPRLQSIEHHSDDASAFFYENPLRTPAIVIQRKFYEEFGGFCEYLKHTADWEMWVRAIERSSGIAINEPLAYYRLFAANDTSRLAKSGDNLRDHLLIRDIFSSRYEDFRCPTFENEVKTLAFHQTIKFMNLEDNASAKKNAHFWWTLLSPKDKVKHITSMILRRDKARLKLIEMILSQG